MMPENWVNEDDLEFDDDQRLFNGVPFTGGAFLVYPNGNLKREVVYADGFPEGLCREWHANGQLMCEWFAVHGGAVGTVTEWHENGVIKSVMEVEHGVRLQIDEWNESGELLKSWRIDETSAQFRYVQQMRGVKPPQ